MFASTAARANSHEVAREPETLDADAMFFSKRTEKEEEKEDMVLLLYYYSL